MKIVKNSLKYMSTCFRTSALRSSQNSLQSNVTTTQRPSSAYYPPPAAQSSRPNLHQSIPNLKTAPSTQRIHAEDARSGSFPSVNQFPPNYPQNQYGGPNISPNQQQYQNQYYPGQSFPSPSTNYPSPNYPRLHEENKQYAPYTASHRPPGENNSYPSPTHTGAAYANNLLSNANGQRPEEMRYSTGLLREDVLRHSQANRSEELKRYPSNNNVRIQEAQIQASKAHDDFNRNNEMRTSKSEDLLRQQNHSEMMRYASSGNIRTQESSKVDLPQLRLNQEEKSNDLRVNSVRGTAKMVEMGEEVRRRQNRNPQHQSYQQLPTNANNAYYQQQQQNYYSQHFANQSPAYNQAHVQNTQNLQNLNLNQNYPPHSQYATYPQQNSPYLQQNFYSNAPQSPNYPKSPPVAPKPMPKSEILPELPPTSTHPLYSSTINEGSKQSGYNSKVAKDPWTREEQERQAEVRREQARAWQDQQIRELMTTPNRTTQQEEQLRVLQLEREFQRRALEAEEQDDEDTEKVQI